jgi:glycosyltransferase involved in cell wall biosynthesis
MAVIRVAHLVQEQVRGDAVATVAGNLLKHRNQDKIKPLIIALRAGPFAERMAALGCDVRFLNIETGSMMNKILSAKSKNPFSYVRLYLQMRKDAKKLRRLLCEEDIDILHTHRHHDHIIGAMAVTDRTISIWHAHSITNPKTVFGLGRWLFNCFADKYAAYVIAISNAVRDSMSAKVREKTLVIHNGIETDRFSFGTAEENKKELGFGPETVLVGAVGRFVYIKGFHDFISMAEIVASKHKDVHFVLVGPDDIPKECTYRDARLRQIEQADLTDRFTITGYLPDPARFMAAIDILVVPTVTWEGFGLVALEAQACGIPVVATDSGGLTDIIVDGETGYIVAPEDICGMAEHVCKLLSDKKLAERMGRSGRARATGAEFNIANTVRQVEEIYVSVVSNNPS